MVSGRHKEKITVEPSPSSTLLFDVDGALKEKLGLVGIGAVLRNIWVKISSFSFFPRPVGKTILMKLRISHDSQMSSFFLFGKNFSNIFSRKSDC